MKSHAYHLTTYKGADVRTTKVMARDRTDAIHQGKSIHPGATRVSAVKVCTC